VIWAAGRHAARQGVSRAIVPLALLLVSACSRPITDDECFQLLEHYTEKVIEQARPSAGKAERLELILEARQKATADPEFARCKMKVSRAKLECALAAHDADQIERCLL
jgi:hypothetical protein